MIGKIEIKRLVFYPGRFYYRDIQVKRRHTYILIAAGCMIFNVLNLCPIVAVT